MNSLIGPEGSRPAPRDFMNNGRNRIILFLLFVVVLIGTVSFTVNDLFFAHAQSSASPLVTPAQLNQLRLQLKSQLHVTQPALQSHALSTSALPAYNNVGVSSDNNGSSKANFDGAGNSYSAQALATSGITPNQAFMYDGITFTWPGASAGVANNYIAAGQVLPVAPVTNATTVGFIGSAVGGPSVGLATITYTDGSTHQVVLGMSDWTLNGGKSRPDASHANSIVTSMFYRNTKSSSKQNVKTYLFYTTGTLDPTKTVQSVTLPASVNHGQIHIFSIGLRANYTNPYNDTGISDDANPTGANLDGAGASYSYQSLTVYPSNASYDLKPGSTLQDNGVNFTWPDVLAGTPDNYRAVGQTVPITQVAHAVRVGFIGASTDGPSCGIATINYTKGTVQKFSLCLSDWTLNGGYYAASFGNSADNANTYRNTRSGQQNLSNYIFYTEVKVDPARTVQSITLPSVTDQGHLHIFSLAASALVGFNSMGARADAYPIFANFDGAYNTYSLNAMQHAGMSAPDTNGSMSFTFNKVSFKVMNSFSALLDNLVPDGQTLPVVPITHATRLAFLGASANGAQVATATIAYTDGTTQTFPLGFNDWSTPSPLRYGNTVALSMPYRDTLQGEQKIKSYLYYMQVSLRSGKTIASVTLPSHANIHIYSMSTGA